MEPGDDGFRKISVQSLEKAWSGASFMMTFYPFFRARWGLAERNAVELPAVKQLERDIPPCLENRA